MKYLFLQGSDLYFVEVDGETPVKPDPFKKELCRMNCGPICPCQREVNEYTSAIASIKAKAVKVGNTHMVTASDGIGTWLIGPNDPTGIVVEINPVSGEFYPIECDVRYEEQCFEPCDCMERCEHWDKRTQLAILSPVSKKPDELCACEIAIRDWKRFAMCFACSGPVKKEAYEIDKYTGEAMRITAQPLYAVGQSNPEPPNNKEIQRLCNQREEITQILEKAYPGQPVMNATVHAIQKLFL